MTVVDASVLVNALASRGAHGDSARDAIRTAGDIHTTAMVDVEVVAALRRLAANGDISQEIAADALRRLTTLAAVRHRFSPFLVRVWELRHNVTPYDAWYVAIAEALDDELVTADAGIKGATRPRCVIRLV